MKWWETCLPHKGGGVPLSALPKDTTSKLASLFSTQSFFHDQLFEDLVRDAEQRDLTIALWVLYRFRGLRNRDCQHFWNFKLVQAERKESHEATKPELQAGTSMDYKLQQSLLSGKHPFQGWAMDQNVSSTRSEGLPFFS